MSGKFCIFCGTQLEENALFCVGCGNKTDDPAQAQSVPNAEPSYAYAAPRPPEPGPQQTGAYQQPPVSQQPGAYNQQPPAGSGYPPQPPAGGYPYAGYSGAANTGYNPPKKGSKGLLIGIIIGLVVLAAAVVIAVVLLRKPPADKPGDNGAGSSLSGVDQGNDVKPSAASDLKKDATLNDIAGTWEGELQFTRMEGFDKLPADELPPDFDEMIEEVLSNPAPLTLEIETDGSWDFYADVVMGMSFSSDDFDTEQYPSNPMLLSGLKNGAFDVSFSEEIDEDDIKGDAAFKLSGTVHENSDGLYIEGAIKIAMQMDGTTVIEEGSFKVTLTEPADTDATSGGDTYDEEQNGEDEDPDIGNDSVPSGTDFSTSTRPELSDFSWYMDGVYYDDLPDDSTPITEFSELTGGWKALFYYDPDYTMDAYGYDYLNVTIDGSVDSVKLTVDWYMSSFGGYEAYDISDEEDSVLYGTFEQGSVFSSGDGFNIIILDFYYLNGRQYAVGIMRLQSGEPTYVALVRP